MSFEELLDAILEKRLADLVKELCAIKKAVTTKEGDDDVWLKVGEAAKLLGCDPKHVNKLIDNGFLSLCYLPGTTRGDRRISRNEVLELKKRYTVCEKTRNK